MGDFISAQISTDPGQMLATGIDSMNATLDANGFPGWSPQETHMAVIILSIIAQMFSEVAVVAATVVPAIWRAFGTQLLNIPYQNGAQASVMSTWNFTNPAPDPGGYIIPAGQLVYVDGELFYVQNAVYAPPGTTSVTALLICTDVGEEYNNLGGANVTAPRVQLASQIDWVTNVVTTGVTSGGSDPQSDVDYQNKLVATAQLQSPRIVTSDDFAKMAVSDLADEAVGITIGRATAIDSYYPDARVRASGGAGSTSLSCTTTNGQSRVYFATPCVAQVPSPGTTVTGTNIPANTYVDADPAPTESYFYLCDVNGNVVNASGSGTNSLTFGGMSGYGPLHLTCQVQVSNTSQVVTLITSPYYAAVPDAGARIYGANIAPGTTILPSPAPTTTGFTMSQAATGSANETVTISAWTNVGRCVTTFLTDPDGNALSPATMDAEEIFLAGFRESTFFTFVNAATYTPIYVTAQIHCTPGSDPTGTATAVQLAVASYLSPANWGSNGTSWLNMTSGFNMLRYNKLLGIIESVTGVDYVLANGLFFGTSPNPSTNVDLILPGPAPLPEAETISITCV